jgi:hypothetical protein
MSDNETPGDPYHAGSVLAEIAVERHRQIEVEGWTPGHDDGHAYGELAMAAAAYACHTEHREQIDVFAERVGGGRSRVGWFLPHHLLWPWASEWWKPTSRRRDLVKAAALIIAEIERLDRAATAPGR